MTWYLSFIGAALIAIATVGFFGRYNAGLAGTFVFLGTATSWLAVVEDRIENFNFSLTGFSARLLTRRGETADSELKGDIVVPVDEVIQP